MKQAYEIIHWPNGKVIQLVETKEHANKLANAHGKGHIVREVWFATDGTRIEYSANRYRELRKE